MGTRLEILQSDITTLDVDAIVNAANESLLGGSGVDGAIHAAAGPALLAECKVLPQVRPGVRCPTGEARITPGFALAARYVIHTVGPVYRGGKSGEEAQLAACYRSALRLAQERGLRSIAFPAISTGAFAYPLDEACAIAVREVRRHQSIHAQPERVIFCAWSDEALVGYRAALALIR
ncbi:MAG: O-acetyl-ADP-ribose deacetylase [Chiayiivirga sp.]|jgi:O-acetyl-ADP-ribose deacetylase (regulator of RNase III)|uniref:O-acetyl-ADP-ribose deacetylase n=1 Tax=Chiayiivirga sp. TaxID=2041042 RepID=UPI0025BD48E7|nr:O-acetyl-ADP-ribose deacetylase [Chiayiivirga sp.]MCI1710554.1 O-acetyl-ADP-ribose deacetylase [Chiayiivirga sp.]MCI1728615.1 O-acetyl-ADP-ribose deacetylase [Chiayiivirga sp.]